MFTSAKDLIARKTSIEQRLSEKITVRIDDLGEWCFKVPSAADIIDAQTYGKNHSESNSGDTFLVYNQCEEPNLRDQEMQASFGVSGPEVLFKLLHPGEVDELAKVLMKKAGYYGGAVEVIAQAADEVKNA